MISFANASLFEQDSVEKQIHIRFDNTEITNAELYAEEFELNESLCSKERLTFGACEASSIKFKVGDVFGSLKGKTLNVTLEVGGLELPLGIYKVDSDRPDADRNYREVVAFDKMADILNADVTAWYNGLTFSSSFTIKKFRDSFFAHLGIQQEDVTLVNDTAVVKKTMDSKVLSGKTVITAICEINGVFGHISREGIFQYKSLTTSDDGVYPSDTLYPSDILFPKNVNSYNIFSGMRISANCEDYMTQKIDKLVIRGQEDDIGKTVGTGNNAYVVEGNPLAWDKSNYDLTRMANNLFEKIRHVSYKPCEVSLVGNPCVEVGDAFVTTGALQRIESYVLERQMKGVQALFDTFVAQGTEVYDEKVNGVEESILRLNGRGNVLQRNVDSLVSEVYDSRGYSRITQLSNSLELKVDYDGIVSAINMSEEGIKISGAKIALEGLTTVNNSFSIGLDGNVSMTRGNISMQATDGNDGRVSVVFDDRYATLSPMAIKIGTVSGLEARWQAYEYGTNYFSDFSVYEGGNPTTMIQITKSNGAYYVNVGDTQANLRLSGSTVTLKGKSVSWKQYSSIASSDYVLVGS